MCWVVESGRVCRPDWPKSTILDGVSPSRPRSPSSYWTAFNSSPQSQSRASLPGRCSWKRDLLRWRPIHFTAYRELSSKKVTEAITAHLLLGASLHPLPCTSPSTLKQQMHGTAYPQQPFSEGKSRAGSKLHILICPIEKHLEIVNMAHCNPITTLFLSFFLTTKFHRTQKNTNFLSSSLSRTRCPKDKGQSLSAQEAGDNMEP